MRLFRPRESRDDLYERLLKEKDKQNLILADEVDYLRNQLGMQSRLRATAKNPSGQDSITFGTVPYVNEDEEDIRDMLANGDITQEDLPEVLEAMGFANTEISGL